jgi:hypothetical protein
MKILLPLVLVASMTSVVYRFAVKPVQEEKTVRIITVKEENINTLTPSEMKEGWISLFDGKTTKGWHVFQNKSDGSAWKAENGTLTLDTLQKKDWQVVGGGDLLTDSSFENYDFVIDWKISQNGNSGLIFNIQDDPKYKYAWYTGPEMQVLDNAGHPDAKIIKHRAGDLYDLISSSKETVKPYGEWNHAEIKLNKGKLDLYLNGTNVVSTTMWDDNWNKLVAGSKFKSMPDFAKFTSGHIGLQDHGNKVWFRNIKIKKL